MMVARGALGIVAFVAGVAFLGLVGLAIFRRGWARRVLPYARAPDVELAFGAPWVSFVRTVRFARRHPRALRWGLVYALHLLVGVDPLAALDSASLARAQHEGERARDPPARR